MDFAGLFSLGLLLGLFSNVLYTLYSHLYPKIVEIEGKYYIRRWSFVEHSYKERGSNFWWSWYFAKKWACYGTLTEARYDLDKMKKPKVRVIRKGDTE